MTNAGLARAAAFVAIGIAFPFVFNAAWLVNIGVLTLMYAALAVSWNLFSGFTGYITLGQAAFFGIGAYATGVTFEHYGIGAGYNPFYALPPIGAAIAFASLPVAWIALRTRAMTFAIVTLTLLFIVQQLAFDHPRLVRPDAPDAHDVRRRQLRPPLLFRHARPRAARA